MTKQFEIGRTYSTRSICDYDCIFSFTILGRTAKSVTVDVRGETVRRGLSICDGVEQFKPFGNYSMCAIIRAEKPEAVDVDPQEQPVYRVYVECQGHRGLIEAFPRQDEAEAFAVSLAGSVKHLRGASVFVLDRQIPDVNGGLVRAAISDR